MRVVRTIATAIASMAVCVLLVGIGFLVCVLPPVTDVLANRTVDDVTSPFSRPQLVRIAQATRDYSFGTHDEAALYQAVYQVDVELQDELARKGQLMPVGFPRLRAVSDPANVDQLKAVCAAASEVYVLSPNAISHLDDVYALARVAYVALGVLAVVAVVALLVCSARGYRQAVGRVLLVAGVALLLVFATLGVFAASDFNRFFTLFHGVLFSQGNWQFAYDSLLICALPTDFWVGMGVVWLASTALCCVSCVVAGLWLRRSTSRTSSSNQME